MKVDFKTKSFIKFVFLNLLLVSLFLSGCEESGSQSEAQVYSFSNSEYLSLLNDLTDIEVAISLEQVLQNTPKRQKDVINTALSRARAGLLLLAKSGEKTKEDKHKAYSAFTDAVKQYEAFRILEVEQERFDHIFNQVRYLKFELAKDLKLNEEQETWTIFNHNFSTSGLEPTFTTLGFDKTGKPSDEAKWFTNFQIDLPKARAQGRDGSYGWMISRPFDLTEVANPSFRYFGSYLVVAPNNVLPLADVLTQVFKTYILLDYKPGDNPETYPADRKILVEYNLDDLPLGRDFDDAWVPFVSLTPYKEHVLAIGFLFDTRGINFTQYYSWTIFDFEINGAGKIAEDPVKYKEEFQGADLGLYKSYSIEFPGLSWKPRKERVTIEYKPEANTNGGSEDKVDTFLLSPKFNLPKTLANPKVKIKESFFKDNFNKENLSDFEILISKNYVGGDSPVHAEWLKLDRNLDAISESSTSFNSIQEIDLSNFLGEEVVFGFRFKASGVKNKDWSIESIQILGQEADVAVIEYDVKDSSENFRLAYFDFESTKVKDYKVEDSDSSPFWQKKTNGFVITGFAGSGSPPLTGASRLILPEIDLTGKDDVRIRLKQKVFFFKDPAVSSQVVKIEIRKVGEENWTTLLLPEGTLRDNMPRDPELSDWIKIPKEYLGSKIEISFKYQAQSGNGGTVEWTWSSLEVGSK